MAARTELTALITRIRELIGDEGTPPVFTDEQIQDALDGNRRSFYFEPLRGIYQGDGGWANFSSTYQNLDSSWSLYSGSQEPLDPTALGVVFNERVGSLSFDPGLTSNRVLLSGHAYSVNQAAIEMLHRWKAKIKLSSFDFSDGMGTYQRSQRMASIDSLITDLQASGNGGGAGGRSSVGIRYIPGDR